MARRRSITIGTIAVLVAAAAAIVFGARARRDAIAAARLPAVPDLTGRPAAMVVHLREADAAARDNARSADAVGALGVAYHADLFYAAAEEAYALASELDPDDWRWHYHLALIHIERGEAAKAADTLKAVLSKNAQHGLGWLRLGDAEFKRARFREARAAYERAEEARASPDAPPAVPPGRAAAVPAAVYASMGLARVAIQTGETDRARERLERVVAAAPRLGAAYRLLADVHRAAGDAAQADRLIRRAARLDAYTAPRDAVVDQLARESRSSVFLLKQIGAADARRDAPWREWLARRATEVDPANPDVIYEMGALLQQSGRSRDALTYFSKHLDMVPDHQQTLVQMGKCYSDLGELDHAEDTLRRALAVSDDAVGWYNLGYVMEQRGREPIADAYYRRALRFDPSLAPAHNNLATLLARRGQFDDAMVHLQTVIRLRPGHRDGYTNLGAVLLQQGKADAAETFLREALELDPTHADAQANLGAALAHRGQFAEALRHLDEALRLNPNHEGARANRESVLRSRR